jgi:hypothetical protein
VIFLSSFIFDLIRHPHSSWLRRRSRLCPSSPLLASTRPLDSIMDISFSSLTHTPNPDNL